MQIHMLKSKLCTQTQTRLDESLNKKKVKIASVYVNRRNERAHWEIEREKWARSTTMAVDENERTNERTNEEKKKIINWNRTRSLDLFAFALFLSRYKITKYEREMDQKSEYIILIGQNLYLNCKS